jgi:glycosyltransferase involved in cell wall biosynthesis
MKVYYIGSNYDGCYYARCLLPQRANGWDGQLKSLLSTKDDPETMFRKAMDSDVIVFHRPDQRNKVEVIPLLKQAGKKVVLDNDDTYLPDTGVQTIMYGKKRKILESIERNIKEAAAMCDLITVSTDWLKKEYDSVNDNVVVLPNTVDPDDWGTPKRNEGDKIRIGLVGSVTSADYVEIKPVLKSLSDDPKIQLVVFGLPPSTKDTKMINNLFKEHSDFWHSLNIEWQPLVNISEYKQTLNDLKLDVALIPRTDNYFNRAKSNIKFLEMAMLEIPCIVSDFSDSPYSQDIHLLKCKNLDEWYNNIELIKDRNFRRELGAKAREYVEDKYNINNLAHLWEDNYKKICEK